MEAARALATLQKAPLLALQVVWLVPLKRVENAPQKAGSRATFPLNIMQNPRPPSQEKLGTSDLLPSFRTKLSMISAKERGRGMSKSRHTEAQMIGALKQLEAGRKAEDVAREVGVSKHTIYAWKAKYGGMDVSQAQEAKQLRDENTKLRKLVADLSLDKEALQSVIAKKRLELVALKADCRAGARAVCLQRAAGVRADDDGGVELPLPDAGAAMSRCARGWWSWRGRSRASGIGGCMCCWAARESM